MQITKHRGIALGTLVAFAGTTLGGVGTPPAHAGSKLWRDLAIGAGVVTGYGLLKHKKNTAIIGGVATGLSYLKYRKEKKKEKQYQAYRYTPSYSNSYSSYSSPASSYRYNSALPYRYSRPTHYRSYRSSRRSYSRSYRPVVHHYRYTPSLHRYPYNPALHVAHNTAVKPHYVAAAAPLAAVAAAPAIKHVLAAQPATAQPANVQPVAVQPATTQPVAPVAAVAPMAPAAVPTANATASGNNMLPFGLGVLASLLGVGLGFGLSNMKRRETLNNQEYPHFEPPRRHIVN